MIKTKYIILFFGLVFYKFLCDFAYVNVISVLFDYQNFENNPTNKSIYISWLFILILSPLIIKTNFKENLSSGIVKVLIAVSLFPTCTMIAYNSSYENEYILLMFIYWIIFLLSNLYLPRIILSGSNFLKKINAFHIIAIVLSLNIIYISWYYTGFRFQLDLIQVYDIRAEAREYQYSIIESYLATFADNLLPVILLFFLIQKKRLLSCIIAFIIILNFGIAGIKQVIFLLFIALIGFYFVKNIRTSNYFIWGFILILLFGYIEFIFFDSWLITLLSTYRVYFIPAKLHYVYYSFFSQNELDYFRQSFLKFFTESPYNENIGFLMGFEDIGDFTARANNGLFSDAYFNFGSLGIIIFPFILVFILKIIEGAFKDISERFALILIVFISFVFLGLPFSTALFSGGIITLIVLLLSMPKLENK